MDGTLVDSEPRWTQFQMRLVEEFGGALTQADCLSLIGTQMKVTAAVLQRAGVRLSAEDIILRLSEEVTQSLRREVPWQPGAYELVQEVAEAGIPQAIVTTSRRFMAQAVVNELPCGAISVVVAGEDVSHGKPDPAPYLRAIDLLGADPASCVAIEDSATGIASALAAGVVTIGVPRVAAVEGLTGWVRFESLLGVTLEDLSLLLARGGGS
jgi:HAD superfamily hydrolase (TIGR01509 family)